MRGKPKQHTKQGDEGDGKEEREEGSHNMEDRQYEGEGSQKTKMEKQSASLVWQQTGSLESGLGIGPGTLLKTKALPLKLRASGDWKGG